MFRADEVGGAWTELRSHPPPLDGAIAPHPKKRRFGNLVDPDSWIFKGTTPRGSENSRLFPSVPVGVHSATFGPAHKPDFSGGGGGDQRGQSASMQMSAELMSPPEPADPRT